MKKILKQSYKQISKTYNALHNDKKPVKSGSYAEWLLDNFYIFTKEYRAFFPLSKGHGVKRQKRLLSFAKAYSAENGYKIEASSLDEALTTAQKALPFSSQALSLLPLALCTALFEEAARVCAFREDGEKLGTVLKSLLFLRELDIKALFEKHSALDRVLSKDAVYPAMTFSTKDMYRSAAETLGALANKKATFVAEKAVSLTKGKKGKASHVGYYLLGEGRTQLKKALKLPVKKQVSRPLLYFLATFSLVILLSFFVYGLSGSLAVTIFSFFPLLDASLQIVQFLLLHLLPAKVLPSLSLSHGIPEKMLVVYPTLLSSEKKAREMAEKIELCYLANREEQLHFAVLGDFKDSETEQAHPEILAVLEKEIGALCEKYGPRFSAFCRAPVFAPRQGKWMGEERKRGALSALNLFLRGKYTFAHTYGSPDSLQGISYVLTLDDDTLLPPDAARKLARYALHPQNAPTIQNGRVVSGYGILQPRVSLRLESAGRTLFSRIFAGPGGMDTYHTACSDFYMDAFGEAIFTGKGLYHVDTFLSCLSFPSDTVLSHDLLEGSYVRCGLVSPVQVFDSFPSRLSEFTLRQHRWIRGDWQLIPWLFSAVRNEAGKKVKNPISALSKWKILDNLRRSLSPFVTLLLLLFGNSVLSLIALFSLFLPIVFTAINALLGKHFFHFGEKQAANIISGIRSSLYQVTLSIAFLAHFAFSSLSASAIGLYRCITKKNTLEWVTASDAEIHRSHSLLSSYFYMLPSVALGIGFIFAYFLGGSFSGFHLILGIIWCFAPALSYIAGRELVAEKPALSPKNKEFLLECAKRIWNFFEEYMTEEDHFLPPDNVQVKPYKGAAHRTSPTNIGLGILACVCAHALGFISKKSMLDKISCCMDSVEKLPTWHGHLYNWYDTRTLKPLSPRYVSTVDSGNFACYLLTAAEALKKTEGGDSSLARRLEKCAYSMDFRPLYHEKKKLFSIGFSLDENKLSNSFYDLLISEARQVSFLAIALGQVPPSHWFALGRGLTAVDGYRGLVSWSGTMFEYFMPLLIMKNYDNSLLSETYRFALRCGKRAGRKRHLPWGVSESGFYAFDHDGNYQYKAFGVEELRLSRQSPEDAVVAPYATFLALPEDTKASLSNLSWLRKEGLFGEYGFYEAVDYTKKRLYKNMQKGIVKSYMAHHQGMSLAAITNVLCDSLLQSSFHQNPCIRSMEPLLKERVPVHATVLKEKHEKVDPVRFKKCGAPPLVRTQEREETFPKSVLCMTNGSYHMHLNTDGEGTSFLDSVHLNPFDPILGGGQKIWILNTDTEEILDGYGTRSSFGENTAVFFGETPSLSTRLDIFPWEEKNGETRRLTLVNQGKREKVFEIYFYLPLSLATEKAEHAHPVFSKLFVSTKETDGVLYAMRKKRTKDEKTFVAFSSVLCEGRQIGAVQFSTDRAAFWGRGNVLPRSVQNGSILDSRQGVVLDPCFAYKLRISLPPGESGSVTVFQGLAETEEKAMKIGKALRESPAPFQSPQKRDISFSFRDKEEAQFLHAAAFLLYGGGNPEGKVYRDKNLLSQNEIWRLGISGDIPIVTVRLTEASGSTLLEEAVRAHTFWERHGIKADLVLLCDEPAGYFQPLATQAGRLEKPGMHIISRASLKSEMYALLLALSSLFIDGDKGGFSALPPFSPKACKTYAAKNDADAQLPALPLLYPNGLGGFLKETSEYVIDMKGQGETPMPWAHVVANPSFGFVADEGGCGYTFYENSQKFRISPWRNDPVACTPSESLVFEEGTDAWSPMAAVFPEKGCFRTRYGAGYVTYERETRGLYHTVSMYVPPEKPCKIILVKVENKGDTPRTLSARYTFLPVLGTHPVPDKITVLETGACVRLRNAFTDAEKEVYLTCEGNPVCGMEGHTAYALRKFTVSPGKTASFSFVLGVGKEADIASLPSLSCARDHWNSLLSGLSVETGEDATDLLVNQWLPYQALACRIYARSGFYQSGGAFGFRDQLQDALALMDIAPHLVKKQLLLHAAYQFEEGDAFHWWHPDETGVRTRFSDDRLFLPYIACIYARETGDVSIWDEAVSFVSEPVLSPEEEERYTFVKKRTPPYSFYAHCVRAIEISLQKGDHGLPLMGGGDWNDGMNQVGIGGTGESVWLGWFLKTILDAFAPVAQSRGDISLANRYREEALVLTEAIETSAWNQSHYARAFFDDGTPLGTPGAAECSIDAISQAWSVLSGGGNTLRQKLAMESVWNLLVDPGRGLVRLLAPPFEKSSPDPGYIQSYPPGIRENGGQYTHAAIWAAIAFAILKDRDKAISLFRMLNPILRTQTRGEVHVYKTEPYVMTADIYTAEGNMGRGGWSWYTGAAAWMYRLAVRHILGFVREGNTVSFSPLLPSPFTLRYRYGKSEYVFRVEGAGGPFTLTDDGKEHKITIGEKGV